MVARKVWATLLLALGGGLMIQSTWAKLPVTVQGIPDKKFCPAPKITNPVVYQEDLDNCFKFGGKCTVNPNIPHCQGTRCQVVEAKPCEKTTDNVSCVDVNQATSGQFKEFEYQCLPNNDPCICELPTDGKMCTVQYTLKCRPGR